jgi:CDP-glycerol glycerophosphotransferase
MLRRAAPIQSHSLAKRLPLRDDVVVWESFGGRGILCHPEAIFREVLAADDLAHLRHVWVLREPPAAPSAAAGALLRHPRVSTVRPGTAAYVRHLSTAGTLVNNATFPTWFGVRAGQRYLNTWHGTPLKTMGFDEPGGRVSSANTVRNFLMATHLLAESDAMRDSMYARAYRLANLFAGEVVSTGSPRTDRQQLAPTARAEVLDGLSAAGIVLDRRPVVLYAPTWRGASFAEARDSSERLAQEVRELTALLPGHRILLRVHQQVADVASRRADLRGVLVPQGLPANAVLGVVDVLVTDYSSIVVDVLADEHDIVLFRPDEEGYRRERGLVERPDATPAPVARTVTALAELIAAAGGGSPLDPRLTHAATRAAAARLLAPRNDGRAAARVVDVVFRGVPSADVGSLGGDRRPSVLMHVGGLKSNGITTSALAILNALDRRRWDITAVFDDVDEPDRRANLARIPDDVRCLPRVGGFATGGPTHYARRYLRRAEHDLTDGEVAALARRFDDEWLRCYGHAVFDHVIDFSGYSPTWAFLLGRAPGATRALWLHNDLHADRMRSVDGRRPHQRNLGMVFASYRFYDRLVSVSRSLSDINAERLAGYAPPDRFIWARNAIDAGRIRRGAGDGAPAVPPAADERTFVTVGRLSPEKNHERLLRAFAVVHRSRPGTRLVVIGTGPLQDRLRRLRDELTLSDSVHLVGQLDNPFPTVAAADVFVLSSDYEGQPMVILEALTLGLPVVTTAFGSVADALPTGAGTVVECDVDSLAAGMLQALDGDGGSLPFDPEAYNAQVVREFESASGLG